MIPVSQVCLRMFAEDLAIGRRSERQRYFLLPCADDVGTGCGDERTGDVDNGKQRTLQSAGSWSRMMPWPLKQVMLKLLMVRMRWNR